MKYVLNSTSVTVFVDGKPHTYASSTAQYTMIRDGLQSGNDDAVLDALNIRAAITKYSDGLLTVDGDKAFFMGEELEGPIVDRILQTIRVNGDLTPFVNFLTLLMGNPDRRAVREAFTFISKCALPITEDGHFLAFKKVRHDYTSIHDGKFMNKIGTTPFMRRTDVDANANRTCSQGLHFCSRSYLKHFSSSGGNDRVLILKINPADIVAIPNDYNHAKGRAWRYHIVGELTTNTEGVLEDLTAWVATDDTQTGLQVSLTSAWDKAGLPTNTSDEDDWDEDEDDWDEDEDDWDEDEDGVTTPIVSPVTVRPQTKPGTHIIPDNVIRDIRRSLKEGFSAAAIAKMHGISDRTVRRIRDNETYTHVV